MSSFMTAAVVMVSLPCGRNPKAQRKLGKFKNKAGSAYAWISDS